MLGTLKYVSEIWQLAGREWIVQMMGPSHNTNFQSNLPVDDTVPASCRLFCRMAQNVVWKLNFRIGNNPPCIKKFQKFCLRKSSWEKFPFTGKLLVRAADVDSWKIARATGTFCSQLPGWSTLCVILELFSS